MSGLFEEDYLDGSQFSGYPTNNEIRDMSEMFDLEGASQGVEDSVVSGDYELPVLPRLTEQERIESPSMATMTATELSSDDDDGLFAEANSESKLEIEDEDSDTGNAGDETTNEDRMLQWKVDHTSGDHKLQVTNFIKKAESVGFDGIQALEVLHRLHTIDYGSRRAGSKAAKDSGEYHPLFFLDYICIVGRPLKAITRASDRFFDNVTVTLKDWHLLYAEKHHYKMHFDLKNRTFRVATAATRETWYIVMHPIVAPVLELDASRRKLLERQAKLSRSSALLIHHTQAMASHIKHVFLSRELFGKRAENEPVFHAYDYRANIEIEVSEGVQTLGRETRLRLRKDSDDEADDDAGGDEGSAAGGDENVLSCDYFQGYSNIKRSIRYNPEDLLVTQGIATAALTLPESAAKGSARVRAIQQRLLRRMQGSTTPDDLDASRPFARERQRIQHAVAESEFAFRIEQVISLDVARLTLSQRNLQTILRPIFQLMQFYLQETSHYTHLLRCFQPTVFPQILGSFAQVFELGLDEMLRRFRAQGS
ncbi:hypothetical protein ACLOAV_005919 [Pseudogymnoascus australis]